MIRDNKAYIVIFSKTAFKQPVIRPIYTKFQGFWNPSSIKKCKSQTGE